MDIRNYSDDYRSHLFPFKSRVTFVTALKSLMSFELI